MILKQTQNWTWYPSCHPSNVGCVTEGKEQCACKYHLTDGNTIYSFKDFKSAEEKWCELTGDKPFRIGIDKWE